MAEKRWVLLHAALEAAWEGKYDWSDGTMYMSLCSTGFNPNILTSSYDNTVSGAVCRQLKNSATGSNAYRPLANIDLSLSSNGKLLFDCDDEIFTVTTGDNLCARYAVIHQVSQVDIPIFIASLSTQDVVATQITIQQPSEGFYEISNNDTTIEY